MFTRTSAGSSTSFRGIVFRVIALSSGAVRRTAAGLLAAGAPASLPGLVLRRIGLFPLFEGVVDFAGLGALERSDQSVLVHDLHEAGGSCIADLELTLKERHGPPLGAEHYADRRLVKLVLLTPLGGILESELPKLGTELWFRLLNGESYHVPDFLVRNKSALNPL
jgi:hypothetical protein